VTNLFSIQGLPIEDKSLFFPIRPSQWVMATTMSLLKGRGYLMRFSVAAACLSLCLIGFSSADDARASVRKETNIPAEGLGPALNALAKDRNFQIVYVTEEIANAHTEGAVGDFTTEEALKRLLTGTGLTFRYLDDKTVTIGSATPPHERTGHASKTTSTGSDDVNITREGKKDSSGNLRVAQVDQGPNPQSFAMANGGSTSGESTANGQISEIIVTAQKKAERLQDVPVPVTALNADSLLDSNQVRLLDYYDSVPNLTVQPSTQSLTTLSIRGIGGGGSAAPAVAVTIDGIAFGSSGDLGAIIPEIDPGDLARIEVLRGPQGTLYGASSMGGLINFVTADPSLDAVSGRIQAGMSSVFNGNELGYDVRGSFNVPLTDTFAVRMSAFHREDPGYVDNVLTHVDGVNETLVDGAHVSALWQPSPIVSLKLSALYQQSEAGGSSQVDILPGFGDLQQNTIEGFGGYEHKNQAYSATFTARLGKADLTLVSGYNVNSDHDSFDFSQTLGGLATALFPVVNSVTGAAVVDDYEIHKFSQELRLSIPMTQHIDWLLGGYYVHESDFVGQTVVATNPLTGSIDGLLAYVPSPTQTRYWELAGFTDVTVHFTDRFQVQIGGRESHINEPSVTTEETGVAPLGYSSTPTLSATPSYAANVFTYLVTPQFKLSPDWMTYARLATGYRPGGANCPSSGCVSIQAGAPVSFAPDKTVNYEIGLKGDFLDHLFTVDASLYYIDWKGIQLGLDTAAGGSYTANAGNAKSQGLELSLESRPTPDLKLAAWVVLSQAELTQNFPANSTVNGVTGDPLPNSSRFSGNLSADQQFALVGRLKGFAGATIAYVGERLGNFPDQFQTQRQEFPAYAKIDLRTGLKYDTWTASLSALNVADRRGVVNGGADSVPNYAFYYINPRTVSLSVVKIF
jgi:iron complex outermembrane recepter protein